MREPAEGLRRIEKAIEADRSEALDALGLPLEDRIGQSPAGAELPPLCREAAARLEADSTSGPAKDAALAVLYAQSGDEDAALQAYRRVGPAPRGPGPASTSLAQAMGALHRHRYVDAEAALLRWLGANPADHTARYELILARRQISMAQIARLLAIAPDSYHDHGLVESEPGF